MPRFDKDEFFDEPGGRPLGTTGLDPDIFRQKQTGGDDLAQAIEDLIGGGTPYILGLEQEENRRHGEQTDVIRRALEKSSGPAFSQSDMDSAYGRNADEASGSYLRNIDNLTDILGGSGITGGGYGAALAANYDLARVGQILSANRSTQLEAVKMNSAKKMQDFNNTLALAQSVGQSPSMLGADWLQNILDVRFNQKHANDADKASRRAEKAGERAGLMDFVGKIGGAALGGIF